MRLLGIDYGLKRTGFALGDTEEGVAVDFGVLETDSMNKIILYVIECVKEEKIDRIVVGLPVLPSGEHSEQTKLVETFIAQLRASVGVVIITQDERYTTQEFQKLPRHEREAKGIDALSALSIVQGYMDREKRG